MQLEHILHTDKRLKKFSIGVFAMDQLPTTIACRPAIFIVNTEPSTKDGQHWLAVYVKRSNEVEFFDSYGQSLSKYPKALQRLLQGLGKTYVYNTSRLQHPLSITCGQYVVYYLHHRCRGRSMERIVNDFGEDLLRNDEKVFQFVHTTYPGTAPSVQTQYDFMYKQLLK